MDIERRKKINKVTYAVIFGILLIWTIIIVAICGGDKKPKQDEPFVNATHAWTIAREIVKDKLKSPSTADFPWNPDGIKMISDSTIMLYGHVDSQNSFGAMIRMQFIIKLKYWGGDWADRQRWQELDFVQVN